MDKKFDKSKLVEFLAGVAGFEPTIEESKSCALPLGDTPIFKFKNVRRAAYQGLLKVKQVKKCSQRIKYITKLARCQ